MRHLLTTLIISFSFTTWAQTLKVLNPTLGYLVDKSAEGERKFLREQAQCELVGKKVSRVGYQKLTEQEKKLYNNCPEDEGYWEILGGGCSWYCGGGQDTASASSSLKASKGVSYSASKSHDLDYKTAWIEGVPGYGIGESLTYHFPPENPRITKIIIVNGYVKSKEAWTDNSRVKKLKMYINNKPFAILNLADTRREQSFDFKPIGNGDRKNSDKFRLKPRWTMRFEILEVYKGRKYDDTVITEIYFDGIDVH